MLLSHLDLSVSKKPRVTGAVYGTSGQTEGGDGKKIKPCYSTHVCDLNYPEGSWTQVCDSEESRATESHQGRDLQTRKWMSPARKTGDKTGPKAGWRLANSWFNE